MKFELTKLRFPNKYEALIIIILGVILWKYLPQAQEAQRESTKQEVYNVYYLEQTYSFTSVNLNEDKIGEQEEIQECSYASKIMYITDYVNIRELPCIDSPILSQYNTNEVIEVIDEESGWYKTDLGWVYSEYVKDYAPENYLDIGLDYKYQDLIRECLDIFNLDVNEYFIYGMIYTESRFNNTATSGAEAQGIIQIIPSTWKYLYNDIYQEYPEFAKEHVLNDPYDIGSNLTLGIYYLKEIQESCRVDSLSEYSSKILTIYNRGSENAHEYYQKYGNYNTSYAQDVLRAMKFIEENKYWMEGI